MRGTSDHQGPRDNARHARVRGTRVPVQTLFDYLEGGETLEDFLEGFPHGFTPARHRSSRRSQTTPVGPRLMRLLIDECVDEGLRLLFGSTF